jgi:hypothetical protein
MSPRSIFACVRAFHPRAYTMLRAKQAETRLKPSVIIRRFGDPRNWIDYPRGTTKDRRSFNPGATFRTMRAKGVVRADRTIRVANRRCHLQHIETGRVINVRSIAAFCRKARLGGNARYHITPVLDGKRLSYKGWYLPATLRRTLDLRDSYGNVYRGVTLRDWVVKHRKSPGSARRLLSGARETVGGVTLLSNPKATDLTRRAMTVTKVVLARGKHRVEADSVMEAAAKLGTTGASPIYDMVYGIRSHYRGYRLVRVKTRRHAALRG